MAMRRSEMCSFGKVLKCDAKVWLRKARQGQGYVELSSAPWWHCIVQYCRVTEKLSSVLNLRQSEAAALYGDTKYRHSIAMRWMLGKC